MFLNECVGCEYLKFDGRMKCYICGDIMSLTRKRKPRTRKIPISEILGCDIDRENNHGM